MRAGACGWMRLNTLEGGPALSRARACAYRLQYRLVLSEPVNAVAVRRQRDAHAKTGRPSRCKAHGSIGFIPARSAPLAPPNDADVYAADSFAVDILRVGRAGVLALSRRDTAVDCERDRRGLVQRLGFNMHSAERSNEQLRFRLRLSACAQTSAAIRLAASGKLRLKIFAVIPAAVLHETGVRYSNR